MRNVLQMEQIEDKIDGMVATKANIDAANITGKPQCKKKLYFFCYFFNINENNQINLGRVFAMSRDYSNMETDQVIKEEIVRH